MSIFKAAVSEHNIRIFNVHARAWAAAAVWLAADECSLSTSTGELVAHFRVSFARIRRCKLHLGQFSTITWTKDTPVRVHYDLLDMILDVLVDLANACRPTASSTSQTIAADTPEDDDDEEEERVDQSTVSKLSDKNKAFVKQVTTEVPKLRKLAITLASRFVDQQTHRITRDAIFLFACVLVAAEAITRRRIPANGNLVNTLAPLVCFGGAAYTVMSKYQAIIRWMHSTFLDVPWIPEEEKRLIRTTEDRSESDEPPQMLQQIRTVNRKSNKSDAKQSGTSKAFRAKTGRRKTFDLVRFFQEIIEYDPVAFHNTPRPLEDDSGDRDGHLDVKNVFMPVDIRRFDSLPPQALQSSSEPTSTQNKRRKIIHEAEQALSQLQRVDGNEPSQLAKGNVDIHQANVQHYLRLLLIGEDASELAVSQQLSHLPVAPLSPSQNAKLSYSQHIARLCRERQCTSDELDVDEDLFMPGEMASYLRGPEEVSKAARLAAASGVFDKHDEMKAQSHIRSKLKAERDKRFRLRQAEKDRLAHIAAGPGRVQQKRRPHDEDESLSEEDANEWREDSPFFEDIHDVSQADFDAVVNSLTGGSSLAQYLQEPRQVSDLF